MTKQKRIFLTGGSGYIGSVIIELAIAQGYQVHALSRSEQSDASIRGLGATPVRGDLTSIDVIQKESAAADHILLLATPYTIQLKSYDEVWPIDQASIKAVAEAVRGTTKSVVITSGSLLVADDPTGAETNEASTPDPEPLNTRYKAEDYAIELAGQGIRTVIIRLAPFVYGRAGSGVKLFMGNASHSGSMLSLDGGQNHITTVHVDDAARLYLLAMEKAKPGETFNATNETHVTARQLFEALANAVGVPVVDISLDDARVNIGPFLTKFLSADHRASGAKARRELGWKPIEIGILEEINNGSYQKLAASLRSAST